jgi:DNA-binding MarR family transcriptional regulator
MTSVAQPLTGQDINLAARATRKALEVVLAEQGVAFAPLATLNTIVGRGTTLERDGLIRYVSSALDVDPQTVVTIVHGLESRGLVRHDGTHLELTEQGVAEHRQLTAVTGQLTEKLYRGLDPSDLIAAHRVLATLTERAEAHVAATLA